jgi:aminotransferase
MPRSRTSEKASRLADSVFPKWTGLARQHGAVNLSQGFPDFPAPDEVKAAACDAINADINQYAATSGAKALRDAIASSVTARHGVTVDPDVNVTVCCGGTESMIAAMMAIIDPGDEVILFEPFYEIYGPDVILAGATPRFVTLREPAAVDADWSFDPDELAAVFNNKTRAIVINTPNNPTGKVFTRDELDAIAALCRHWDVIAVMDEIYERITYDGAAHVMMASIDGMAERTITINSLSKTFSVTGWRVGWTIAPPAIAGGIRKVHELLTVSPASPFQAAGAAALALPDSYFQGLAESYRQKRERLLAILTKAGFLCYTPRGAYYIITDIAAFGFRDDNAFAEHLVTKIGVAALPGSGFYHLPDMGRTKLRWCFCKKDETLAAAEQRLGRLR